MTVTSFRAWAACIVILGASLGGCGQPRNVFEHLAPTSANASLRMTGDQAKSKITGHTFLRNYANRGNEVLYFAPNNVVYQWISGRSTVATSTWTVDLRSMRATESAEPYICTNLPYGPDTGTGPRGPLKSRCIDPSLLFIAAAENSKGDVLSLAGQAEAPLPLQAERTTIQDIKKAL